MAWPSTGSYTAWSKCFKCTTQATKISAVNSWYFIDLSLMPPAFWSAVQADGDDLRFVEDDLETAVNHKLIFIDTGTSTGLVAVAQPHGASGATVDIDTYCFAGNAAASSTSTSSAFPSSLTCLYMLQEAPTSATAVLDWTSNARNSTAIAGSMTSGDLVTGGPHGGLHAVDFDSNDRATIPGAIFNDCESANQFTWFGWVRLASESNNGIFGAIGVQFRVRRNTTAESMEAAQRNSANSANFTTPSASELAVANVWYHLAAVYNGSTLKLYQDGVEIASTTATSLQTAAVDYYLGHDNVAYARARLAEIGLYSQAFSADKIATIYANETDAGFWVVAEHTGDVGADVTGTAAGSVSVTATATGARGVAGTVSAPVSVAGAATGFRGVLGTVAAAVSVVATATGVRGGYGVVSAVVSAVASALGLRGAVGTAAGTVTVSGHATDFDGAALGTALAPVSVAARAVGFVGSLGPADGRSIAPYLTGAAATGAPAREVDGSTGGYRSGVRFQSMEWDGDDPLVGVRILEVSGGNGQGIGTLTAATAGSVAWTPPGGTAGTALTLAVDAEGVAPGADTGAWVRLRRTGSNPLEGAKTLRCLDVYNNLFPDVVTSDAVAGLVTARALMLLNSGGAVRDFRAWLGDCDGDFEIALELPTAGELTGAGLTWSAATTEGAGPVISLLSADGEVGLRLRRTVAADTAASPSQLWAVNYSYSDGSTTYTGAVRGRYRIEREDLEAEGIWIGDGEQPDFDGAPAETWTTRPHTTALGLTLPTTVYMARRTRNKWGLWGIPTAVERYDLDAGGAATLRAPSGPTDVSVMQTSANKPTVAATYDAAADGETIRAALWCVWLTSDGTDPDGTGDPDGYARVQHNGAIDDLAWISTGDALADGTVVRALVRLRRLDDTGTAASPDVIQLTDSGAGVLKFDQAITDWDTDGYAAIRTRFGRLLEVIHYSGLVVASGQTTVTVDERGLMGTTATETNPNYVVAPVVAVDSENTAVATWTISGVASGRPWGALIYGAAGAQAQAAVEGPDGVTPQVLDAGENVHLMMGEGWSSLYVDTVLVWRCLYHGDSGEANGFYIPSEWTLVTATITGASAGTGPVDAVDSDTIYLVVRGQRRVLIDLAAMEIHAADWNGSVALEEKAEQDGVLEQFGATLFLTWDPAREDYRPSVEVTSAGVVNGALAINQGLNATEVIALWQ